MLLNTSFSRSFVELAHQNSLLIHIWTLRRQPQSYAVGKFETFVDEITFYQNLQIDGVRLIVWLFVFNLMIELSHFQTKKGFYWWCFVCCRNVGSIDKDKIKRWFENDTVVDDESVTAWIDDEIVVWNGRSCNRCDRCIDCVCHRCACLLDLQSKIESCRENLNWKSSNNNILFIVIKIAVFVVVSFLRNKTKRIHFINRYSRFIDFMLQFVFVVLKKFVWDETN